MSGEDERRPALEPGFLAGDTGEDELLDDDLPAFLQSRGAPADDAPRAPAPPPPPPREQSGEPHDDLDEAWEAFATAEHTDVVPLVAETPPPLPLEAVESGAPMSGEPRRRGLFRRRRREEEPSPEPALAPEPPAPPAQPSPPAAEAPATEEHVPAPPPAAEPPKRRPALEIEPTALEPPRPLPPLPSPPAPPPLPVDEPVAGDEAVARWRGEGSDYEDTGWERITAEFRALRAREEAQAVEPPPPAPAVPTVSVDDLVPDEEEVPPAEAPSDRNLPIALLTGLAFGLLALALIHAGRVFFLALVTVLLILGLIEFYTALRHARFKPAAAPGLLGALVMLLGTYTQGAEALGFGMAMVLVFTLLWFLLGVIRTDPVANFGVTVLGVLYIAFFGSFAVQIISPAGGFPDWAGITIGYLALAIAADVGGYLVGSRLGTTYIFPAVSPHKSVQGLIGGAVLTAVVALGVVQAIDPFDTASALGLALLIVVAAPLGDLLESMLKRAVGVKDLGSLLPGHGGVLDRIDSILVVAPVAYYFARYALY